VCSVNGDDDGQKRASKHNTSPTGLWASTTLSDGGREDVHVRKVASRARAGGFDSRWRAEGVEGLRFEGVGAD
jgi:hypothetical protein